MTEDIDIIDEILEELKEEEKQREIKRQKIIKKGCPHTNKIERIYTLSREHYLECDVCHKQFDMQSRIKF